MARQVFARLAPVVVLFLLWEMVAQLLGNRLVPPASKVLLALAAEARSGELWRNLGVTLSRVACAFALAMTLGTVLGVLMGRYRRVDRALDSVLTAAWQTRRCAAILVTHDMAEAASLADRILMLSTGPARVVREWVVPEASRRRGIAEGARVAAAFT